MSAYDALIVHVTVDCPYDAAYAFLREPTNFPAWASGLGAGLERRDGRWLVDAPQGRLEVRFSEPNAHGVLDHWVHLMDGEVLYIPLRVIASGDGCLVSLTLFKKPATSAEELARDKGWVERDLHSLKVLLERDR
jgi:hypothetical protein